jgi:hypothetical protein
MRRKLTAVTVAALLGVVAVFSQGAQAEPLCTIEQVTDGGTAADVLIDSQAMDADGSTIGFRSNGNYLGTNGDGNQELWLLDEPAGDLTQVTSTTGPQQLVPPNLSDNGGRLVFTTIANLGGVNADGNNEVLLYTVSTGLFSNISATAGGPLANTAPKISGNGKVVVYSSIENPLGTNADLSREIFSRVVGGSRAQITQSTGGLNEVPTIDDNASTIILRSNRNLNAEDNTDGNQELFAHEVGIPGFEQLTFSTGGLDLRGPVVDATASEVAMSSERNHTGGNSDGGYELFRLDPATALATQLTSAPSASNLAQASISLQDGRLAWVTATQLVPSPTPITLSISDPGQAPVLVADTGLEVPSGTSMSEDGTRIAFVGSADLTGDNPDGGDEVFVASCGAITPTFTDVPTTHAFFDEIEWMAAADISTGFQPGPEYRPDQKVSRAAMSAFMYRLAGQPAFADPPTATFTDVPTTSQFFTEIEWMNAEGITTGFPGGLYKPDQAVTRAAMSAFMYRLAGSPPFADPPTATFTDVPTTSQFFTEIEWMADEGITTGFQPGPTYKPASAVSRSAMSAFMFRLADGPGVDLT